MEKKYKHAEENPETSKVSEPAFTYQVEKSKTELPEYSLERLEMQAEQAIDDFEKGICIPHEKIKRR